MLINVIRQRLYVGYLGHRRAVTRLSVGTTVVGSIHVRDNLIYLCPGSGEKIKLEIAAFSSTIQHLVLK